MKFSEEKLEKAFIELLEQDRLYKPIFRTDFGVLYIEFTAKNSMKNQDAVSISKSDNKTRKSSVKGSVKSSVKIIDFIGKNKNITIFSNVLYIIS